MRPVYIDRAKTRKYKDSDECALGLAGGSGGKRRSPDITRQTVLEALNRVIDKWIENKCPTEGGRITFDFKIEPFIDAHAEIIALTNSTPDDDEEEDDKFDKANGEAQLYRKVAKLLQKGGPGWGNARRDLIEAVGPYCSYCGSPIYSHLAIEHRLPKNTFPLKAFEYKNFLLACATCNSAKGDKPNQATVPGNPKGTDDATKIILNDGGMNYLWADCDWTQVAPTAPSLFPFTIQLTEIYFQRGSQPRFGSLIADGIKTQLFEDFKKGSLKIEAGFYYHGYSQDHPKTFFGTKIIPTPGLSTTDAADRLVEIAKLNNLLSANKKANSVDRRIETRTRAFFTAQIVKQQLNDALTADPGGTGLFQAVIEQAKQTIKATGQWLVWFTVLGSENYNGVSAQALIRQSMVGTSPVDWVV